MPDIYTVNGDSKRTPRLTSASLTTATTGRVDRFDVDADET